MLVFSTKNCERWLRPEIEEDVWRYLGGICRAHQIKPVQIGGFDDHVHLLLGLPPTLALSNAMKRIKGESSKWLSAEVHGMKGFAWQDGYGAFSVGKSQIADTGATFKINGSIISAWRSRTSIASFCTSMRSCRRRDTSLGDAARSLTTPVASVPSTTTASASPSRSDEGR